MLNLQYFILLVLMNKFLALIDLKRKYIDKNLNFLNSLLRSTFIFHDIML